MPTDPVSPETAETVIEAKRLARAWLARNVVKDGREPELDEGDCTICGTARVPARSGSVHAGRQARADEAPEASWLKDRGPSERD